MISLSFYRNVIPSCVKLLRSTIGIDICMGSAVWSTIVLSALEGRLLNHCIVCISRDRPMGRGIAHLMFIFSQSQSSSEIDISELLATIVRIMPQKVAGAPLRLPYVAACVYCWNSHLMCSLRR